MLESFFKSILSEPALIPAYAFFAFLLSVLGWEIIKFIIFIIRNTGKGKK